MIFYLFSSIFNVLLVSCVVVFAFWHYLLVDVPDVKQIHDIELQIPLRVYGAKGELIAEFGEQKRIPVYSGEIPQMLKNAFIAVEDKYFYQHSGIDVLALVRAINNLIGTGKKSQGGSTITMQLARLMFLSPEKSYIRKAREIVLALQLEKELTKEEILSLYLNKVFFGHRSYGIKAAALTYYGKELDQLTLAQMAMLASLPKAPSRINPLQNPTRAKERRDYVLSRLFELGFIEDALYQQAKQAPLTAQKTSVEIDLEAPYLAEMVRSNMVKYYGEAAYTGGYHVYTTINAKHQNAAYAALRKGLEVYDKRHGYRGPKAKLPAQLWQSEERRISYLDQLQSYAGLLPAIVIGIENHKQLVVSLADGGIKRISKAHLRWALPYSQAKISAHFQPGDLIWIRIDALGKPHLAQEPQADGAIVSVHPRTGAITALVGGYSYARSKFNRATMAKRQPGSGFKPFIYSAALAAGYQPADLINDAPVVIKDTSMPGGYWRPQNANQTFVGLTTLRKALAYSRNLISIRLLRTMGMGFTSEYLARFGFNPYDLPKGLSMALGTAEVSPLQMAEAYTAFANKGIRTEPYFIQRIEQEERGVIYQERPRQRRAITPENSFLIYDMLKDVFNYGTATGAKSLKRKDIAGKTGSTNNYRDAWLSGFNESLVAVVWIGRDDNKSLGNGETGGQAALPVWIDFMGQLLPETEETELVVPEGIERGTLSGTSEQEDYIDTTTMRIFVSDAMGFDSNSETTEAEDNLF